MRIACCDLLVSLMILTVLMYHSYLMSSSSHNSTNEDEKLQDRLKLVHSQIKSLRRKYSRLFLRLKQYPGLFNDSTFQLYSLPGLDLTEQGPKEEYENTRRRMYLTTKELWYYVSHQLRSAFNKSLKPEQRQNILKEVADRKRWLLSDQETLQALDGYNAWRRREADSLNDLIQRRLHYLQNPPNCRTAKKILCHQDRCGLGCNTHHLVYCLVVAYALKRTMVLKYVKRGEERYLNIFHPLSETCAAIYTPRVYRFTAARPIKNIPVLYLQLLRYFNGTIRPYVIPEDLADRIVRFNGDPYSWWIGQLVKYILKLRRWDVINATMAKINFTSPIVGVHIRRTDKIIEAEYHDVDEYMSHVADFYAQLELTRPVEQRRVYLATDDVNVVKEVLVKYPQYTFYGDYSRVAVAGSKSSRYTVEGSAGVLIDIYMLSMCDHVVCTFSSNVGRLSYELMQTYRIDAVNRFTSLDEMYYFTKNEKHIRKAVMRNKDVALEIGDLIEYGRVNASSIGNFSRINARGPIPWYKTEEVIMQHLFS